MKNVLLLIVVVAICARPVLRVAIRAEEQPSGRQGPVLHYTFESLTADSVANEVGDDHTGRINKAFFTNHRLTGRALFVRKDKLQTGYIETADHEDINSPTITVAAWIKLRRENSNGSVICKHDWPNGTTRGFVLRCYTAEFVNFTIGAGGWIRANGTTRVPTNQWVHVAGTFDGKHLRAFFNGRLEGTTEVKQTYTPSPLPLRIGHAAYALERNRKFDGQIDDVIIWKRKLTEKELRALYNEQKKTRPRPLTAADITPLIEKLGEAKFKVRNEAEKKLISLDTEVLPLLKAHQNHGDPEIAWRLKAIEKAINADLLE